MSRIAKKTIDETLAEAEKKFNLRDGVLSEIYEAESRVVFLSMRRGISSDIRKIVQNAIKVDQNEDK